jgi:hypothetical protein
MQRVLPLPASLSACSIIPVGGVTAAFAAAPNTPRSSVPGTEVVTDGAVIDFELELVPPLDTPIGVVGLTPTYAATAPLAVRAIENLQV